MFGTYLRLGVHVWASDREVIRAARSRIVVSSNTRQHRREYYRLMLQYHHEQQNICLEFRL